MVIHVCSLNALGRIVAEHRCSHVVTLINGEDVLDTPGGILAGNHLRLAMNDIAEEREGFVAPSEQHVADLIDFAGRWERNAPMAIHCWAGISRSTAAAYVTLCALNPDADERALALRLREASATATPNPRIVAFGDRLLGRSGRMIKAIDAIGFGRMAPEGIPFSLPAMLR